MTNALPVPISGFDLMLFNNTPATGMLDTANPSGHPNNYAHFHNTTAVDGKAGAFAPETLTTSLPDFTQDVHGLAPTIGMADTPPSEIRAAGILIPGAKVSTTVMTMQSVERAGMDNGFGINSFPSTTSPTSPPTITGLPTTENGTAGLINPFVKVTITDTNTLPIEIATITVRDGAGALSDAVEMLSAAGVTHTAVGLYTLPAALPADLTAAL